MGDMALRTAAPARIVQSQGVKMSLLTPRTVKHLDRMIQKRILKGPAAKLLADRKRYRVRAQQLCEAMGISPTLLSFYESGRRPWPADHLKLARVELEKLARF